MKASIIVLNYKAEQLLRQCLESIFSSYEYEILVVDNDNNIDALKSIERIPYVKILSFQGNLGFAGGNNRAIRESRGEYIVTINADVVLSRSYIDQCIVFLENHPEVASVQGKLLLLHNPKFIDSTGNVLTSIGFAYNANHRTQDRKIETIEIFGVCAAAAVYRKVALDSVMVDGQYFDEDFFAYLEDVDLDWRLRLVGYSSFFLGDAIAYHIRESSSNYLYRLRQALRNRYFLMVKNSRSFSMVVNLVLGFPILLLLPECKKNIKLLGHMMRKRKKIMLMRRVPFSEIEHFFTPIPWSLWIQKTTAILTKTDLRF